jgi:hypothetical protein
VPVEDRHARIDDRGHVELTDPDEEITVQPGLDVGAQLLHVDARRWCRHLDDDVDERVDITGPDGDHEALELEPP